MSATATATIVSMLPKQIALMADRHHFEILASGAFRSGKTRCGCYKLLDMASAPGSFVGLCRKTLASLRHTTLRTLLRPDGPLPPVLPEGHYVHRKSDSIISLHGGGDIYYFGFDHPERLGSLGFDAVVIDEGIELEQDEYTMLVGRCSGQAGRFRQIVTVTNPGPPSHFLHRRFYDEPDPVRRVIESTSLENWFLPADYVAELRKFTGTDHERYVLGKWTAFEGLVYPGFRMDIHVAARHNEWKRVIFGIDEGYTHPGVVVVVGVDGDERAHLLAEFYQTGVEPAAFVRQAAAMQARYGCQRAYVDPSAAGLIADLRTAGVPARKADNAVFDGIRRVADRLTVQGDGRPRLTMDPGCVNVIREFGAYLWKPGRDEPVKKDDDAMDALRYAVGGLKRRRLLLGPMEGYAHPAGKAPPTDMLAGTELPDDLAPARDRMLGSDDAWS